MGRREAGEVLTTADQGSVFNFTVSWLPDSERLIMSIGPLTGTNGVPGNPLLSRDGRTLYVREDRTDGEI